MEGSLTSEGDPQPTTRTKDGTITAEWQDQMRNSYDHLSEVIEEAKVGERSSIGDH